MENDINTNISFDTNNETKKEIKKESASHTHIVIIIISTLALLFSIFNFIKQNGDIKTSISSSDKGFKIEKGVDIISLYVGLTDKDENRQLITKEVAKEILKTICITKNMGYTIYEAEGAHKDNENILHTEATLVLELDDLGKEELMKISDEICNRLNIQSIFIVKKKGESYYHFFK